MGAQTVQTVLDVFISTVYLGDVVYAAGAARSLTGAKVYFPRELSDSDEAGFGWSEIVGFKLIDSTTGREVGTIDHVDDSTINTLFDINTPAGDSLLVPAHEELIEKVDAEARAIWTRLPEGIMDI